MTYDVFICYESTTGTDFAEHLKTALEKAGHTVFLADITIRSGGEWGEEINSALTECKYFIVLITALTMGSKEVMKECNKATKLKKRIIPCRYSKIGVSETKELARLQQLEFEDKTELANRVIIEIRKISSEEIKGIKIENDPEEFLRRGNLFFNLGNFSEALKAYDKAIEINPRYAGAWDNKGVALSELGRHEEALKAFDKAIEIKPDFAEARYNRACMYSLKGNKENALRDLSMAIDLDAEFKEYAKKIKDLKSFGMMKILKRL